MSAAKGKKKQRQAADPAASRGPTGYELDPANGAGAMTPWEMTPVGEVKVVKELNAPPMVQMKLMPIGAVIDGTVLHALPSQREDIKSPIIVIQLTRDGSKVSVPGQASIASTLLPEYDKNDPEHLANPDKLLQHKGERITIKRSGTKESRKWKDDQDKPRRFPVYEICVVAPASSKK